MDVFRPASPPWTDVFSLNTQLHLPSPRDSMTTTADQPSLHEARNGCNDHHYSEARNGGDQAIGKMRPTMGLARHLYTEARSGSDQPLYIEARNGGGSTTVRLSIGMTRL